MFPGPFRGVIDVGFLRSLCSSGVTWVGPFLGVTFPAIPCFCGLGRERLVVHLELLPRQLFGGDVNSGAYWKTAAC